MISPLTRQLLKLWGHINLLPTEIYPLFRSTDGADDKRPDAGRMTGRQAVLRQWGRCWVAIQPAAHRSGSRPSALLSKLGVDGTQKVDNQVKYLVSTNIVGHRSSLL